MKWFNFSALAVCFILVSCGGGGDNANNADAELQQMEPSRKIVWENASLINSGIRYNVFDQFITTDSSNTVSVIWTELISSGLYKLNFRQHTEVGSWGTIFQLPTPNTWASTVPQLVSDSNNVITAIWNQDDPQLSSVFTSQFSQNTQLWTPYNKLNNITGDGLFNESVIDNNGGITKFWVEGDFSQPETIISRRFTPGAGWAASQNISEQNTYFGRSHKSLVSSSDDVAIFWTQPSNSPHSVWYNRYIQGVGWAGPQIVSGIINQPFIHIYSDFDSMNNLLVAWMNEEGNGYISELWVTRINSSQTIETKTKLATANFIEVVDVFVSSDGKALLLWLEEIDNQHILMSSVFKPASGWSDSSRVTSDVMDVLEVEAHLVQDKVWVVWQQNKNGQLNTKSYSFVDNWSDEILLKNTLSTSKSKFSPKFASNANGKLMLLWSEKIMSNYSLWAFAWDENKKWSQGTKLDTRVIVEKNSVGGLYDDNYDINLIMDDLGNTTAIWTEYECTANLLCWSLWSARHNVE